ncbi:MAG: hypothetical protein IJA25_08280, partial [Anaerotignum sp.]|nr:hypothetical protein [Anaerotignum sp.]
RFGAPLPGETGAGFGWFANELTQDMQRVSVSTTGMREKIEKMLDGNLQEKRTETGNMKRMKFYRCAYCGNILWSMGGGEISCCGRKTMSLQVQDMDDAHDVKVEEIDREYYVTFAHVMEKDHFISFAALVSWDRVTIVKLYPEQASEVTLPRQRRGEIYLCCSEHGLFRKKI